MKAFVITAYMKRKCQQWEGRDNAAQKVFPKTHLHDRKVLTMGKIRMKLKLILSLLLLYYANLSINEKKFSLLSNQLTN